MALIYLVVAAQFAAPVTSTDSEIFELFRLVAVASGVHRALSGNAFSFALGFRPSVIAFACAAIYGPFGQLALPRQNLLA